MAYCNHRVLYRPQELTRGIVADACKFNLEAIAESERQMSSDMRGPAIGCVIGGDQKTRDNCFSRKHTVRRDLGQKMHSVTTVAQCERYTWQIVVRKSCTVDQLNATAATADVPVVRRKNLQLI
jgi:hypothetical protein